jgi:hypothetical protein
VISPKPKKPAYIIALQQFLGGNCRKEDNLTYRQPLYVLQKTHEIMQFFSP